MKINTLNEIQKKNEKISWLIDTKTIQRESNLWESNLREFMSNLSCPIWDDIRGSTHVTWYKPTSKFWQPELELYIVLIIVYSATISKNVRKIEYISVIRLNYSQDKVLVI